MSAMTNIAPGEVRQYKGSTYQVLGPQDDGRWSVKLQDGKVEEMSTWVIERDEIVTPAKPKTTYTPIPHLSYCATHGNTQDAGEWVDDSGDECCESWFGQDDPARCVICDVYAKVPAT